MSIVKAARHDAETIASIVSLANRDVAEQFGINRNNNPKHPSFCDEFWIHSDLERGQEYFIYCSEQEPIGCVAFENPMSGVGYLNRLSVLPAYRGKGVGEALVRKVFDYAIAKGIDSISIGIIAEHSKLKHWYLKLGFTEGEIKTFSHLPFDVQFMRCELGS